MSRSRVRLLGAAFAALWLTGCSSSPPLRLYVLSPMEDPADAGGSAGLGAAGLGVGIGPVRLAPHLDRPQIVSRRGNEVHLGELDRWAEPLADGIAQVLAENLGRMLATDRLWHHPWPPSVPVEVQVAVEVLRCDDAGDGDGMLAARWTLSGAGGMLATRRFERREPAVSLHPAATVEALSRALAELSREIAEALAEHTAGLPEQTPRVESGRDAG